MESIKIKKEVDRVERNIQPNYLRNDIELSRYKTSTVKNRKRLSVLRKGLLLFITDMVAMGVAVVSGFALANVVRYVLGKNTGVLEFGNVVGLFGLFSMMMLVMALSSLSVGHYTKFRPFLTELLEIWKVCIWSAVLTIAVLYLFKIQFSRTWLVFFCSGAMFFIPVSRFLLKRTLIKYGMWFRPTLIVGIGENARRTARAYDSDSAMGCKVIGFIDLDGRTSLNSKVDGRPVYLKFPGIKANEFGIDTTPELVFAFETQADQHKHREIFNYYVVHSNQVTVSPPIKGLPLYGAKIVSIFKEDAVLLDLNNKSNSLLPKLVKRTFDLVVSSIALIVLSPLLAMLAALVKLDGGSIIFGHERLGRNGVKFKCLKFRTMVPDARAVLEEILANDPALRLEWEQDHKLRVDPRLSKYGFVLRKFSLDELPQLLNVLKGEMSLVGPRPIVEGECCKYGEYIDMYYSMTPGITGLWQASGRNDTGYAQRVQLDVWYSRNWSLWNDIVIILKTVPSILNNRGAY